MRKGLRKVTKTVRGKKGSVQRSYWVKAAQVANKKGSFAAMNHPGAQAGSDHSWLAIRTGQGRGYRAAQHESSNASYAPFGFASREASISRAHAGAIASDAASTPRLEPGLAFPARWARDVIRDYRRNDLAAAFGVKRSFVVARSNRGSFG